MIRCAARQYTDLDGYVESALEKSTSVCEVLSSLLGLQRIEAMSL